MRFVRRLSDTIAKMPYISLAVVCLLVTLAFNQTKQNHIPALMIGALAFLMVLAFGLHLQGQLTNKRLVLLLIAAGIILRLGYSLYTPYFTRQHDVGVFNNTEGHAAYIKYIADNLTIPSSNAPWQFYHPPLHHILAGIWLRLNLSFGVPADAAYENIQIFTSFYSCAALLVCYSIIQEMRLSERASIIALCLVCFNPTFIILAGNINNDMLMILFFLAVMLFTLRWYNKPSMHNILLIALFLGLAMMSKLSAVLLAPAIAFVFLIKMWQQRKEMRKLFSQFGAFCAVSIPLGMWYPIRNLLLFKQSFTYVPAVAAGFQDVGKVTIADRLWNIPWSQLLYPYQNWKDGYNIPLSIMKTATFGESDFKIGPSANVLLYVNILLAVIAVCAMIWILIKKDKERSIFNWTFFITWSVLMASYVKFCFDFPQICTQDFRYIVPTLIIGAVFIGQLLDRLYKGAYFERLCAIVIESLTAVFCVFSAVAYIALGAI